jgi:hypothetical protein
MEAGNAETVAKLSTPNQISQSQVPDFRPIKFNISRFAMPLNQREDLLPPPRATILQESMA